MLQRPWCYEAHTHELVNRSGKVLISARLGAVDWVMFPALPTTAMTALLMGRRLP